MILDRLQKISSASVSPMRHDRPGSGEWRPPAASRADTVVTHNFDRDSLCTEDLVFLYQNIDAEAPHLVSSTKGRHQDRNQLVEAVVYDNDSDVSYASESAGPADLHDLLLIDEEQFEIFGSGRLNEHQLCHKFSELAIHLSNLSVTNDRNYTFRCPRNAKGFESTHSSPYCKSLRGVSRANKTMSHFNKECFADNYHNVYMENVIKFVNSTLDQLKRISNGEYLSPKAKAKWCKIGGQDPDPETGASTTSAGLPPRIETEPQLSNQLSKLEELVHSEIDIKSLAKMLEKRIVFEMPRMMYDSVRFLEQCKKNLKLEAKYEEEILRMNSQVDTLFELQRSGTAFDVKEFRSILLIQRDGARNENVIVQTLLPTTLEKDTPNESTASAELLSITYVGELIDDSISFNEPIPIDIEHPLLSNIIYKSPAITFEENIPNEPIIGNASSLTTPTKDSINTVVISQSINMEEIVMIRKNSKSTVEGSDHNELALKNEQKSASLQNFRDELVTKSLFNSRIEPIRSSHSTGNDIRDESNSNASVTVSDRSRTPPKYDSSNMQSDCLKGTTSPVEKNLERGDIIHQMEVKFCSDVKDSKSPYDSSIFLKEEKRKKILLENRDRRLRNKVPIGDSCNIMKDKSEKVTAVQASRSVTKSPSKDKSSYNLIDKESKIYTEQKNETKDHQEIKHTPCPSQVSKGRDIQNEIADKLFKNDYLQFKRDTAASEIALVEMSEENSGDVTGKSLMLTSPTISTSVVTGNQMSDNLRILPPLSESPTENGVNDKAEFHSLLTTVKGFDEEELSFVNGATMPVNVFNFVHDETPKENRTSEVRLRTKKRALPQDCRKSIDKIYDLMKRMVSGEHENGMADEDARPADARAAAKGHDANEFTTSHFNLNRVNRDKNYKANKISVSIAPKTNASIKSFSARRFDVDEKNKLSFKERGLNNWNGVKHDTTFGAVSRALRTFDDSAQSVRRKHGATNDNVRYNKPDVGKDLGADYARCSRPSERRGRECELQYGRNGSNSPRKKCLKFSLIENTKAVINQDNGFDSDVKRNICDVIEEAKEARGEAVRGPPRRNAARLDALAQPRRPYVQAHSEYYRRRYGRTLVTDRLQRLAAPAHAHVPDASPQRSCPNAVAEHKKLVKSTPVRQKQALVRPRSRSAESRAPSPPPAAAPHVSPPRRLKTVRLAPRHNAKMTFESPIKGQRLLQKDYAKVKFEKVKRVPLQRIPSNDSYESGQKAFLEESTVINQNVDVDNASNHNLLKTYEDSMDEWHTICSEHRNETKILDTTLKIKTRCAEDDTLSIGLSGLSNFADTDNTDTNVTTNLSLDQRNLEDKFDVRLNFIRQFNKSIQNAPERFPWTHDNVRDGTICDVFQGTAKFNEEPKNCMKALNQIVIVKSGNPVPPLNPEPKLFSVSDMLPMILKTHLDLLFPDFPIQISNLGYALSEHNNKESTSDICIQCHKCNDITRQITDKRLTESLSTEVVCDIRNHQPEKSILPLQSSLSKWDGNKNGSVLDTEIKPGESYISCNRDREMNESELSPNNIYYDGAHREKIETKIISDNESRFSHQHFNENSTHTADKDDGDPQNGLNSSSSLDILVGLLNEIKKISKCQAYIATNYDRDIRLIDDPYERSHLPETWNSSFSRSRGGSSRESEPTRPSWSNSTEKSNNRIANVTDSIALDSKCVSCDIIGQMTYDDKGISVDMSESARAAAVGREDAAEGARSGRREIFSGPSSSSMFSSKALNFNKRKNDNYHRNLIDFNVPDDQCTDTLIIYKKLESTVNNYVDFVEIADISKEKPKIHIGKSNYKESIKSRIFDVGDARGRDPLLKLKRDILVMMYSVFVFAVFAALSFSQIICI